jgi:hypothetical protein
MIDAAQEIAALRAQLAEREAELAVARAELTGAKLLIEQMKAQLAKLRRMQFGRSSEKLDTQIQQLELMLEDLEEGEATRLAQLPATGLDQPERQASRRQPGHALTRLTAWTMITMLVPSSTTLSTAKPKGTSDDGRNDCCMTLIPHVKPTQASTPIASNLSQTQNCVPVDSCLCQLPSDSS